jgi:putative hydrolase of the HAD superfamily
VGFIFDMGNVLSRDVDVLPCVAARLGMPIGEITAYAGEDFADLLVGATTADRFWQDFNRRFGTDVREDLLSTCFRPANDPEVERLIVELKAAGHRVVCGTNAFESHYRHHLARGEYAVFDRVYASNRMGVAKPSPAFYHRILAEEDWRAGDTFFVDDRAANVEAARALGMRAFLYPYESKRALADLRDWIAGGGPSPAGSPGVSPDPGT